MSNVQARNPWRRGQASFLVSYVGSRGKTMQRSDDSSDPFDSKAAVTFLTLTGLAFCGLHVAASLYGLFQALHFWSSYNLAMASVFQVS
jgi:hypothetical protein